MIEESFYITERTSKTTVFGAGSVSPEPAGGFPARLGSLRVVLLARPHEDLYPHLGIEGLNCLVVRARFIHETQPRVILE
jgi:hypothetical protein